MRDIVTARTPPWATNAVVAARIALRTSSRCDSTVSFHSLGTAELYGQSDATEDASSMMYTGCLDKAVEVTMSEHPPSAGPVDDAGGGQGTPRWVKVSLVVLAFAVIGVVVLALVGGGHGPGRHGAGPPSDAPVFATI